MSETQPAEYRVLARKYRPATFDDLVGQEPMVRTLTNAFATGRIAQAYMLTGVRGVGKTTTARILARALNYETAPENGGVDRPTIDLSEPGIHCPAIMEGRHVDVIEMDAASHTGIDDIREVIAGVRYRPTSARYKVYIVDEVHMLSKSAFNALLKTLEEPPEHVKFIFATTEIRKVPITVLSRCQRFDLRRIGSGELMELLGRIAKEEGVAVEDGALATIARAGEGSARDALSLLDQAIAHAAGTGGGAVEADGVRSMLGLADRSRVIELFDQLMRGDVAAALDELKAQYDTGADPAIVLTDLAEFVHFVTRVRFVDNALDDPALTEEERGRGKDFAGRLNVRVLGRTWQMLLKGIAEVEASERPLAAADMVLVRIAHAADLPSLDQALKGLEARDDHPAIAVMPAPTTAPMPTTAPTTDAPSPTAPATSPASAANGGSGADPTPETTHAPSMSGAADDMPGGTVTMRTQVQERVEPEPRPAEPVAEPFLRLDSFEAMVRESERRRDIRFTSLLRTHVDPVAFDAHENGGGRVEFRPVNDAPADLANTIAGRLRDWTGRTWPVVVTDEAGEGALRDRERDSRDAMFREAEANPVVQAALRTFPGARIVDVRYPTDQNALPDEPDVLLSTGEADETEGPGDDPGPAGLDDYYE